VARDGAEWDEGRATAPGRALVATQPPSPCARNLRPTAPFLTQLLVAGTGAGRAARSTRAGDATRLYAEAARALPRKVERGVA
jgi:hypothetical protein